jgi:hypothetical protein
MISDLSQRQLLLRRDHPWFRKTYNQRFRDSLCDRANSLPWRDANQIPTGGHTVIQLQRLAGRAGPHDAVVPDATVTVVSTKKLRRTTTDRGALRGPLLPPDRYNATINGRVLRRGNPNSTSTLTINAQSVQLVGRLAIGHW